VGCGVELVHYEPIKFVECSTHNKSLIFVELVVVCPVCDRENDHPEPCFSGALLKRKEREKEEV
jgi:hypothetical protein